RPLRSVAARHFPTSQDLEGGPSGFGKDRQAKAHLQPGPERRAGGFRLGGPCAGLLEPQTGCAGSGLEKGFSMKEQGEVIPESAVRFVRELDARCEKIWSFLTDSRRLPEWY